MDISFANPQFKAYKFKNDLANYNFGKTLNVVFTVYIPRDCNFMYLLM